MRIDAQHVFASSVAFTVDAASTNYLDLGVARDIGDGEPMSIYIHTTVAADHTTGNETYAFILQTDDNTAFSSATDLLTQTISYTLLTANSINEIVIPAGLAFERYNQVAFDGGGTTPTITCSIWLGRRGSKPTDLKSYPNGYDA